MFEDRKFATEKLTACIEAALCWPAKSPTEVREWYQNESVVRALIESAFEKYEKTVINRCKAVS